MEAYKTEKSVLRNVQTQQIKALEKELKKKKLTPAARAALEESLEETLARHKEELEALAEKYSDCNPEGSKSPTASKTVEKNDVSEFVFPEHNWNSMSKKELEVEAARRGLGKKGNKEELTTKLVLFSNDQKARIARGELNPKNVYKEEKKRDGRTQVIVQETTNAAKSHEENTSSAKTMVNQSRTAGTSWAKNTDVSGKPAKDTTKKPAAKHAPSSSDSSDSSSSSSSSDDDDSSDEEDDEAPKKAKTPQVDLIDVPDSELCRGFFKPDARSRKRRTVNRSHRRKRPDDEPEEESLEERQQKREAVLQKVLIKMLKKNAKTGVKLDDIEEELKKMKVLSFRPELLGYDSVEEWIGNQPGHVLFLNARERTIYPSRQGTLPSDDDSESS